MDFSAYPLSERYYGGSEKKIGVLIGNSEYMLKFQTRTAFGLKMNHVSEYLGCHVFELMGIPAQESYLGRYMGEEVVACKNFIGAGEQSSLSTMLGKVRSIRIGNVINMSMPM